ncbi:MAG: AAA family ATPase [bacterium]|nr:AAA family ATPase [bacterium]
MRLPEPQEYSAIRFLETVRRAKAYLEEQGRVSLRALSREFELDEESLADLVEELVDVQQVAARESKVLSWVGSASATSGEGTPMAAARPSAEAVARPSTGAERRQLTVMFCDLVDSTDLSQRLDVEDLRNIVRAYHESASRVVEDYEGHVAQYLGDGLLIYFGYPQAREDAAERAVRAGREILTALVRLNGTLDSQHRIRLSVRIGIHTGPVVVGEMGGGAKSETLALGDTTNIAARLQAIAEADTVVVSGATLRLVRGKFSTKDLGTPELKGITEPIHAYSVLRSSRIHGQLDVDPRKLTPLVGRDQELGLLLERWEKVEEGEGQAVFLSGEAGLGKTRLFRAFRERMADTPHGWLECRCSPYTQRTAFQPVIDLLEQEMGFQSGDDPETKLARLEEGVAAAGLSVAEALPLLAPLLSLSLPDGVASVEFSRELQRKKTIEALVACVFGLAESQPLVLLVEDLHWCDASTLELLGWFLEQNATAKVLTLMSFRPDFEPPWPVRSHITPLAVKRLSRRQATNLVGRMTRDVPLPIAVIERVVERADGVPLFVEELTKMVLESGLVEERESRYELTGSIAELAVPATLQDSLMARLDRLDDGKEVAQLGAVLGREFNFELLRSVWLDEEYRLRAGLVQLVDAELLFQRGAPPAAEFTFKHALIQETAYQSLLRSDRQQFHARIARVLEEQFPERVRLEPEVIAWHCDQAGLAEKAIANYQRAGEQARERTANEEAVGHIRRALELLTTLPESPQRDRVEIGLQMEIAVPLGVARGFAHLECQAAYQRAYELAERTGDAPELPRALVGLSMTHYIRGELATSRDLAERALAAAEPRGDTSSLAYAHESVGQSLYWEGELSRALHHFEQAILLDDGSDRVSLATPGIDWEPCVVSRSHAAHCHWVLGRPDRARALSLEAVTVAEGRKQVMSHAIAFHFASLINALRGEYALTLQSTEEHIALCERLGFPVYVGLGRTYRGWARAHLGEADEGIAEMQRGIVEVAGTGGKIGAGEGMSMFGEVLLSVGRGEEARGALGIGSSLSEQNGEHLWDVELRRLQAEILLDVDDASTEAEGLFQEALEIARNQKAKSWELRAATGLARLWQRQGRESEARDLLAPVHGWFSEGLDTRDLKDAKALLEQLA